MENPDMDSVSWLRFAIASTTVLGLMALLAYALKYLATRGILHPRGIENRMALVSSLALDGRRRLVLTRCDDTEYLLLLGASGDLLLRTQPAKPPAAAENPKA